MKRIFVGAVLSFSLISPITLPVMAAPVYRVISRDTAMQSIVEVQGCPGHQLRSIVVSLTSTSPG